MRHVRSTPVRKMMVVAKTPQPPLHRHARVPDHLRWDVIMSAAATAPHQRHPRAVVWRIRTK
jgi:hypothetical protein